MKGPHDLDPDKTEPDDLGLPPPPPPPIDEKRDSGSHPTQRVDPKRVDPPSKARIPIAHERGKDADAWIGSHVGPYLVKRKLAKGGMGHVFLGFDEALRRPVALKIMEPGLLTDEDALKRFEREARATAAVQHRHIAGVYLIGLADNGQPFLAMEYVDGGTILHLIRKKSIPPFSECLLIMEQVASALGAAKKLNIIHRDIKPANIMLTAEGEAKVVDFGLAKIFFEDSYRTQEGMVLGTPTYMAPEQSQGRVVDHRADIYSLGATFYHLFTGRPPFMADSPVQIMMKHVTAPLVPMRSINPAVPIELDEVIGRCMRKDMDERYQDYETLLADIQRVRLMCVAREKGAIVDQSSMKSSAAFLAPPTSVGAAPSGSGLAAPPSTRGGNTIRHASGQMEFEGEAETGWTPLRIGIVAGTALLVLVGVVFGLTRPSGSQSRAEGESEPRRITIAISKLFDTNGDKEAAQVDDHEAFNTTRDILRNLREGVNSFHMLEERYPESLPELVKSGRVYVNFRVDSTDCPLDGWGVPIAFERTSRTIRSAGIDQTFYTDDDLVLGLEGDLQRSEIYDRLEGGTRQ